MIHMNLITEMTIGEIDLALKVVAAFSAAIAFIIGLRQYIRGQHWQKAQVLLTLMDSFETDKQIEAACAMLDWDEREVTVGEDRTIKFRNEMLVSALRVPIMDIASSDRLGSSEEEIVFTNEESMIRDAFDAFFDFFDKLYAFQRSELLTFTDYTYFYYWFELIRVVGNYKQNQKIQTALDKYIIAYHFRGFQRLLEQYKLNPDPLILSTPLPSTNQ